MNSSQWIKTRNAKRQSNPLCEMCLQEGIIEPMREVHHIVEIESGRTERECWDLALRPTNLMSLCHKHHKEIHTGSHTNSSHKKRCEDRLNQWINNQTKRNDTN